MNWRQPEPARRLFCGLLLVIYLLVTSSANLFHTELYDSPQDRNDPPSNQRENICADDGSEFHTVSTAQICPICAFFKTHHSQVYQAWGLMSLTAPPAPVYHAVEVVLPYKHPLGALQTRAPPV